MQKFGTTILIFGVSGAGKSTGCLSFVSRHPRFLYFRASSILGNLTNLNRDELRRLSRDEILNNQALLSDGLRAARAGKEARPAIVDAHSVIVTDREMIPVPVEAVKSLAPDGLVFLDVEAVTLGVRRSKEPVHFYEEMTVARELVFGYSQNLKLPLEIVEGNGANILEEPIRRILNQIRTTRSKLRRSQATAR